MGTKDAVGQSRNNATALLGAGPDENPTVDPQEGGGPARAVAAVAGVVSGFQELDSQFPGVIPPEVMQYAESLMQVVPQLMQQKQQGMLSGAGNPPNPAMAAMAQQQGQGPGGPPPAGPGGPPQMQARPPMAA